jgi:hypothetical protein
MKLERWAAIPKRKRMELAVVAALFIVVIAFGIPAVIWDSPVGITKIPPSVERKEFDESSPPPEAESAESKTIYDFICEPDLEYKMEEEQKISDTKWQVRLRITKAKVQLSLPITVFISRKSSKRRSEFEDGHVKIFTRVYVDAQGPAAAAGKSVIGREFFGEAPDAATACDRAIEVARREVREQYGYTVEDKARDVLEIYDFYAPHWKKNADVLVDKALHDYELGKPRKLSSRAE